MRTTNFSVKIMKNDLFSLHCLISYILQIRFVLICWYCRSKLKCVVARVFYVKTYPSWASHQKYLFNCQIRFVAQIYVSNQFLTAWFFANLQKYDDMCRCVRCQWCKSCSEINVL